MTHFPTSLNEKVGEGSFTNVWWRTVHKLLVKDLSPLWNIGEGYPSPKRYAPTPMLWGLYGRKSFCALGECPELASLHAYGRQWPTKNCNTFLVPQPRALPKAVVCRRRKVAACDRNSVWLHWQLPRLAAVPGIGCPWSVLWSPPDGQCSCRRTGWGLLDAAAAQCTLQRWAEVVRTLSSVASAGVSRGPRGGGAGGSWQA